MNFSSIRGERPRRKSKKSSLVSGWRRRFHRFRKDGPTQALFECLEDFSNQGGFTAGFAGFVSFDLDEHEASCLDGLVETRGVVQEFLYELDSLLHRLAPCLR